MTNELSSKELQELKLRLKNCLQTILDLKEDLDAIPYGASFLPELGSLENFLSNLVNITVSEAEVRRVELATDKFLVELRPLMEKGRISESKNGGVLH